MPSHDTYQRLWDALSPTQFQVCFSEFLESLKKVSRDVVSTDGKTIQNSAKGKALHIVSAWCSNNQMVFAQEKVDSNPKMLKLLDLENKVITIDTMGCQRDICRQIVDEKGHHVISLKGNQGTLCEDVKLYLSHSDHHE